LRASLPVVGRAIALYEELHPENKLGNRCVQYRFLDRLNTLLSDNCWSIIIADAGFRVPFFRHVQKLGWYWLARTRNRMQIEENFRDSKSPAYGLGIASAPQHLLRSRRQSFTHRRFGCGCLVADRLAR
jgi:hypothetical protein